MFYTGASPARRLFLVVAMIVVQLEMVKLLT
jgi:hypothetical protein